jgi:uncharacterized protein YndB with AHSA1/START domain
MTQIKSNAVGTPITLTLPSDREVLMTRTFNAPRALVFDALTNPEHVARWYGLRGSSMAVCEIDLKPGGKWRYVLREGDGSEYAFSGVYQEVVAPERLVYTEGYEAMPGTDYVATITLTEQNGGTLYTSHSLYQTQEHRDGHLQSGMEYGSNETLERLEELLHIVKGATPGTLTRILNAPRAKVWQAFTDPEQLKRWWGPKDYTAPTYNLDLQVGGKYLYAMRAPDGMTVWGTGVFKEIVPMERLVYTDSFADEHGNVLLPSEVGMGDDFPREMIVTVLFEDFDGGAKTRLTLIHEGLPAGEMSQMTMGGWSESFDKLANRLKA